MDIDIHQPTNSDKYSSFVYYTIDGLHDSYTDDIPSVSNPESKHIYAKKLYNNQQTKFFIRVSNSNKLYNPLSIYDDKKTTSYFNQNNIRYIQTRKNVFDLYLKFLRTKNVVWFNQAQREV
jgi:hypothetical protein